MPEYGVCRCSFLARPRIVARSVSFPRLLRMSSPSSSLPRARRPRPRLAIPPVVAWLPLVAIGCISINTKGYPAVERTDLAPLVATAGDTAWVLARPPLMIVGRARAGLEVPVGLTGVVRGWERMFGTTPTPATVVLVELSGRGRAPAAPPVLPDSLTRGTVVWVPTVRFADDGGRTGPQADRPVRMAGGSASPALQLAQVWLDARTMSSGSSRQLPPWLRAGLVDALGGLDIVDLRRRGVMGRGGDEPLLPLDTLLARECPADWAPVIRWHPARLAAADSAPTPGQSQRDRADEIDDLDRVGADDERRAACGPRLRIAAGSFVRYLLERSGDTTADALVRAYSAGGTLEQALAGRTGLPATRPELQRAWQAWEAARREDARTRRPM